MLKLKELVVMVAVKENECLIVVGYWYRTCFRHLFLHEISGMLLKIQFFVYL